MYVATGAYPPSRDEPVYGRDWSALPRSGGVVATGATPDAPARGSAVSAPQHRGADLGMSLGEFSRAVRYSAATTTQQQQQYHHRPPSPGVTIAEHLGVPSLHQSSDSHGHAAAGAGGARTVVLPPASSVRSVTPPVRSATPPTFGDASRGGIGGGGGGGGASAVYPITAPSGWSRATQGDVAPVSSDGAVVFSSASAVPPPPQPAVTVSSSVAPMLRVNETPRGLASAPALRSAAAAAAASQPSLALALGDARLLMLGTTADESLVHVFTYLKNAFAAEPGEENFDLWTLSAADAGGLIQRVEAELLRVLAAGRPRAVAPEFKFGSTYSQSVVAAQAQREATERERQLQEQVAQLQQEHQRLAAAVAQQQQQQQQPTPMRSAPPLPADVSQSALPPRSASSVPRAPPPPPPSSRQRSGSASPVGTNGTPRAADGSAAPPAGNPGDASAASARPFRAPPQPGAAQGAATPGHQTPLQGAGRTASGSPGAAGAGGGGGLNAPPGPLFVDRPLKETMQLLRRGAVLTKFALRSDGNPQLRFFRLENQPTVIAQGAPPVPVPHLCWSADATSRPSTYLCLMNLVDIVLGAGSPRITGKFRRNAQGQVVGARGEPLPENMCLTYVFRDREVNVCAPTERDFDLWCYGMAQVLERNRQGNYDRRGAVVAEPKLSAVPPTD